MARPPHSSQAGAVAYQGEVWTDARGYATVELPADAGPLLPPLEYALRDLDPPSRARVTAELRDGRFMVATDEPHVKVGWRLTGQSNSGRSATDPERSI